MKHTTKIITLVLSIALVGGILIVSKTPKIPVSSTSSATLNTVVSTPATTESKKSIVVVNKTEVNTGPRVTIEVNGATYTTPWQDDMTLLDGMNILEKNVNSSFSFKSKSYSSLGEFIYEINGIKESPGKYWLYYVNGKQGSVGVSKYELQQGDRIEWRQE